MKIYQVLGLAALLFITEKVNAIPDVSIKIKTIML